ncbi:MAG TPA: hypothetical protein VGQ24_12760, partial [Gemmatimonadales bacterium]|nr:hypothetical protein [Gemmatimonadales bacterium]
MSQGWFRRLKSAGVGLAFALGLVTAGLLHLPYSSAAQQQQAPYGPGVQPAGRTLPPAAASLQNLSEAFASVAEHVKPSVVYIKSGRKPEAMAQRGPRGP